MIIVLAMIPAMTPASDDGDGGAKVTSITVTGTSTATINYDGGSLDIDLFNPIEMGLYLDGDEIKRTTNQNLSGYQENGDAKYWTCPADNNRLELGSDSPSFGVERYVCDFDSASTGKDLNGDNVMFLYKNPGSKLFQECTEEERKIIWESFFVTSPYKAWDTPEPSNNDVNTVLITTVISMLFISIAVVAVRSFGGRE